MRTRLKLHLMSLTPIHNLCIVYLPFIRIYNEFLPKFHRARLTLVPGPRSPARLPASPAAAAPSSSSRQGSDGHAITAITLWLAVKMLCHPVLLGSQPFIFRTATDMYRSKPSFLGARNGQYLRPSNAQIVESPMQHCLPHFCVPQKTILLQKNSSP